MNEETSEKIVRSIVDKLIEEKTLPESINYEVEFPKEVWNPQATYEDIIEMKKTLEESGFCGSFEDVKEQMSLYQSGLQRFIASRMTTWWEENKQFVVTLLLKLQCLGVFSTEDSNKLDKIFNALRNEEPGLFPQEEFTIVEVLS